jgi:septal ring-binding cell division protein DamX
MVVVGWWGLPLLSGWLGLPAAGPAASIEKITKDPLLQQRILATQGWLTKAHGQAFTLQVMQTTNMEDLIHLLRKPEIQPLLEDLYLYQDNLTQQWEVFYAEFADAQSALAAIESLPKVLQRNKPFLRKIAKVP